MPEIGEVARVVHFLRKNLMNRVITGVRAAEDDHLLFGKVGTDIFQFRSALVGKTVLDAQQQGKYFWLVLSAPPHPLLHFGMTGWMEFSNERTFYYRSKSEDEDDTDTAGGKKKEKKTKEWPPRFTKFVIETADGGPEAAFIDARRLGRARLVDIPAEKIREVPPLSLNGPDPVRDREIVTFDWLADRFAKRHVPVKAWLLDQANLSGVGNWVADELLYASQVHPAALCSTLSPAQVRKVREALLAVTGLAVDVLAESDKFPEDWIMKHRWGKGKNGNKLPNGERLTFVTVGGRTSAVVVGRQKMGAKGKAGEDATAVTKQEETDDEVEVEQTKKRKTAKSNGAAKVDVETKVVKKRKTRASIAEDVKVETKVTKKRAVSRKKKT